MPAHKLLPDTATLRRWLDEGLTHQQIADRHYRETGIRVARSSVSVALSRMNMTEPMPRYEEELPWRVRTQHIRAYQARMLRLLGRRRADRPLTAEEAERLDSWLAMLDRENAVVAYDPDSPDGFLYVEREDQDGTDVPIRKNRVYLNP